MKHPSPVAANNKFLTLSEVDDSEDGCTVYCYDCDYDLIASGDRVKVDFVSIVVHGPDEDEDDYLYYVDVSHDGSDYYFDGADAFEEAISKLVGFSVTFTESGMQDRGLASMEALGGSDAG